MGDYSASSTPSGDSELQDFLMAEKQKAQVNAQVSVCPENSITSKYNHHQVAVHSIIKPKTNLIDRLLFPFVFRFTNSPKSVGIDVLTRRAVNLIARPKRVYQIV